MTVTVYTTNCPQCKMLEAMLKSKNIPFSIVYGEEEILKRGFQSAPILEVDGKLMSFKDSVLWFNSLGGVDNASAKV